MSSLLRIGRGGAGNFVSQNDAEEAEKSQQANVSLPLADKTAEFHADKATWATKPRTPRLKSPLHRHHQNRHPSPLQPPSMSAPAVAALATLQSSLPQSRCRKGPTSLTGPQRP